MSRGYFMGNITPKQKDILDFILSFLDKEGYSPSLEEIAKRFKKSIPTIHQHVEALKSKGFLLKEDNVSRGISLKYSRSGIFLMGYIAAGKPIEPIENPEPINVPANMVSSQGNYYALKVKGDSMIDDGILDGDIVVIKHQKTADSGETVVAITEDGATLKIFKNVKGKIFLEPRNKTLKNIYPKELEIRGKLVGLLRN
jgi:SOS regulatory protein LexA